jgi:hypothetical protein
MLDGIFRKTAFYTHLAPRRSARFALSGLDVWAFQS